MRQSKVVDFGPSDCIGTGYVSTLSSGAKKACSESSLIVLMQIGATSIVARPVARLELPCPTLVFSNDHPCFGTYIELCNVVCVCVNAD